MAFDKIWYLEPQRKDSFREDSSIFIFIFFMPMMSLKCLTLSRRFALAFRNDIFACYAVYLSGISSERND